jgi:hypothetical protein
MYCIQIVEGDSKSYADFIDDEVFGNHGFFPDVGRGSRFFEFLELSGALMLVRLDAFIHIKKMYKR